MCEVDHALDGGLGGASDENVFEWAQERGSLIVTYHEDYADQRLFSVGTHRGIVRLRVEPTTIEVTCATLDRLFAEFEPWTLDGKLVIVDGRRIRIVGRPHE